MGLQRVRNELSTKHASIQEHLFTWTSELSTFWFTDVAQWVRVSTILGRKLFWQVTTRNINNLKFEIVVKPVF